MLHVEYPAIGKPDGAGQVQSRNRILRRGQRRFPFRLVNGREPGGLGGSRARHGAVCNNYGRQDRRVEKLGVAQVEYALEIELAGKRLAHRRTRLGGHETVRDDDAARAAFPKDPRHAEQKCEIEVDTPGQPELFGEALRLVGADDLGSDVRGIRNDQVIALAGGEQTAGVVIEHMVQEAAERKMQRRIGKQARQSLPGHLQCRRIGLVTENLNVAFQAREEADQQLPMPDRRIEDPKRTRGTQIRDRQNLPGYKIRQKLRRIRCSPSLRLAYILVPGKHGGGGSHQGKSHTVKSWTAVTLALLPAELKRNKSWSMEIIKERRGLRSLAYGWQRSRVRILRLCHSPIQN